MAGPRKRSVAITLSAFVVDAVTRDDGREHLPARLARAIRFYLEAANLQPPGWAVPPTLREVEPDGVEVELLAPEELCVAFEEEAGRQGVSVSRLAAQAAIFYAAELDAGRVTERILEHMEDEGSG